MWDLRFYRVVEYASAGFRSQKLEPGDIFPSLADIFTVTPDDGDDNIEESFDAMRKMLNVSTHFDL